MSGAQVSQHRSKLEGTEQCQDAQPVVRSPYAHPETVQVAQCQHYSLVGVNRNVSKLTDVNAKNII